MIPFLLLAGMLVLLVTLALVLAARRAGATDIDRERVNVAIYRERLAELDAERESGRLDTAQHAALVAELQRLLVDDVDSGAAAVVGAAPAGGRVAVWLLLLLVPLLSFGIYLGTGFEREVRDWVALSSKAADVAALPRPLSEGVATTADVSLPDAARLTQALLGRRPADAEAWYQLGMTWIDLDVPMLAIGSLRTARRLAPQNLDITLTLARVELALAEGRLSDEVRGLLDAALAIAPGHQGVLMVYGMAAFENGDYATAARHWKQLLAQIDPASEGAAMLARSIEVAGQKAAAAVQGAIPVRVSLAPALGAAPAEATLFIIVRPVGGPPMPVAAKRLPPSLPVSLTVTDADQMVPGAPFVERGPLEVLARLSLSGAPMPGPGDIESTPVPVTLPLDAPVTLILDKRRP